MPLSGFSLFLILCMRWPKVVPPVLASVVLITVIPMPDNFSEQSTMSMSKATARTLPNTALNSTVHAIRTVEPETVPLKIHSPVLTHQEARVLLGLDRPPEHTNVMRTVATQN